MSMMTRTITLETDPTRRMTSAVKLVVMGHVEQAGGAYNEISRP